jgi:hypothetical protein
VPAALPVGAAWLMLAAVPSGALGGVALPLPAPRWQRYTPLGPGATVGPEPVAGRER